MLGSAVFRTGIAPGGTLAGPWVRNPLWTAARAVPSLDLRFADNKSLTDAVTSQNLVTFTRASSGTYVDSQGVIQKAVTNLLLRSEEFDNSGAWQNQASTETANIAAAPNGTLTADEIIEDSQMASHYISQNFTSTSGITYTYSCYIKAGQRSFCFLVVNGTGTIHAVSVNLSTGAATFATGSPSNIISTAVGNGWYRVSFTYTSGTTGVVGHEVRLSTDGVWGNRSYTGNGTGSVYAWGAQLEASSAVGEYVPTTSTINSAPRFDHNPTTGESLGLLVEEQRTNSIRNNTMVGAVAGTPGTLPTNWVSATPGGLTREIVGIGTQNGISYLDVRYYGTPTSTAFFNIQLEANTGVAAAVNQTWTTSVWVALVAGSLTNIVNLGIGFLERDSGGAGLTSGVGIAFTPTSEFNRQTYTRTLSNSLTAFYSTNIRMSFSNTTVPVDLTIRIGLPQLEQGAFATSVIPTTTAAATRSADVASITGSNFGVSRTNLLLQSNQFDTTWTNTNTTELATQGTSPDGSNNAWRLTDDSTNATHLLAQTFSWSAVTTTFSIFAKYNDHRWISIRIGPSGSLFYASFDLLNGTAGLVSSGATSSVQSLANGWMRLSVTATLAASGSAGVVIAMNDSDALAPRTYSGTGTSLLIYGAQLETGSAATAYIPTTSAAVTVVDSPWYRQDEGTLYGDYLERAFSQTHQVVSASNGTASERISMAINSSNVLDLGVISGGVDTFAGNTPTLINQPYKVGFAYRADNSGVSANGSAVTIDSAVVLPTVSQLDIGARAGSNQILNSTIYRFTFWPQRLSNEVLQRITQ